MKSLYSLLMLFILTAPDSEAQTIFKDIVPGSGSSNPTFAAQMNNGLLFFAKTDSTGREIWFTDGTQQNTYTLADITPGPFSSGLNLPFTDTGISFFIANKQGENQLWKTDGTPQGTVMIKSKLNTVPYVEYGMFVKFRNKFLFSYNDSAGNNIWESDGTVQGTKGFLDIDPFANSTPLYYIVVKDKLYFAAQKSNGTYFLYESDGSKNGTVALTELGMISSKYLHIDSFLYYTARPSLSTTYPYLYRFNLNSRKKDTLYMSSTEPVQSEMTAFDKKIYYSTYSNGQFKTWVSDGTPNNASPLILSDNSVKSIKIDKIFRYLGFTLIRIATDVYGVEYWKLENDGLHATFIYDIFPGTGSSNLSDAQPIYKNGKCYFTAISRANQFDLWETDGTTSGTDSFLSVSMPLNLSNLFQVNNKTFVIGLLDTTYGAELYSLKALNTGFKNSYSIPYTVYPNPVSSGQVIHVKGLDVTSMEIVDAQGRILAKGIQNSELLLPLNIVPGYYFLRFCDTLGHTHYNSILIE